MFRQQRPDLFVAMLTAAWGIAVSASSIADPGRKWMYIFLFATLAVITAVFSLLVSKRITEIEAASKIKARNLEAANEELTRLRNLTADLQRKLSTRE